jgi:thymidylate synthase
MLQFDLREGFPALTTKKLAFKQVVGELLGFIRGFESAADFRKLGCTIWDANANENKTWLENPHRTEPDDLGYIYGSQWRRWDGRVGEYHDQLLEALRKIYEDPTSRRNIVTAWNPSDLDYMALPPCHLLYQFLVNVERKELNMCMYQRSCDMFLGIPFNMASYALLLEIVSRVTGYKAAVLTMFLADVHVYVNHEDQVREQLNRNMLQPPRLVINAASDEPNGMSALAVMEALEPDQFELHEYRCHPPIQAPMAV